MIAIDQHLSVGYANGQVVCGSDSQLAPARRKPRHAQAGAVAILFCMVLLVLFGFIGLALELSILYNRKVELQALADAAAIAAASQLVGTKTGVQKALSAAATEATNFRYQYHQLPVTWSDTAIKFSASATAPDSDWVDATSATASPQGLMFAKVDTSALDSQYGAIDTVFMRMISDANATVFISAGAIAGRSSINVVPLAICALSTTKASPRNNTGPAPNVELLEYGFRRGVGYDLNNLNSETTTRDSFVIDPIAPLGAVGSSSNTSPAVVGPFVCAGKMPRPRVTGATIAVSRLLPIASLFNQLNSRFDQYGAGVCTPSSAPPDTNIKAYVSSTSVPWMSQSPGSYQTAASSTLSGHLDTIASLPSPPPFGTTAPMYGPLWSFAKAVPYSSYVPGTPEPAAGYTPFATAAWTTLYNPSLGAGTYPAATPYGAGAPPNYQAPSAANGPGVRLRRVLNVPLLSCSSVPAGTNVTATVLGIGRFFMTVPATSTTVSAEFAGLVEEESLGGAVELVR